MTEVTVGIDIGTTSVKGVAADGDGRVLARARVPHKLVFPAPDRMEHDAGLAWRRGPRRVLASIGGDGTRAVCVAAMVPSMTGVDRRGIPRTPGLLYGDARGANRKGGANPSGSFEGQEFVRWTAGAYPGAGGYWPAPTVANFALSGEAVLDSNTAMTLFPLHDGMRWDEAQLAAVGATLGQMPRVFGPAEPAGKVGDAILAAGNIDALGEQIVAGADHDGDVLVICGTTLIIWAVTPTRHEAPGLWTIPHTTEGKFLIGGASNSGGLFLNWARKLVTSKGGRLDPHRIPVWTPYPRGERTPFHDPNLRAGLHGLDLTQDAGGVRRGAYEAAGFVVRHHLDLARLSPRRIVATGGGCRVSEWVQALADCTELPVDVVAVPEGGALGAAWIARIAAGLETSLTDAARWSRISHRVEPDREWEGGVRERYAIFRRLVGEVS